MLPFHGLEVAVVVSVAVLLAALGLALYRLSAPAGQAGGFPKLTVARSRRRLGITAFTVAPAVAAGILAGLRLGRFGEGAIVAFAIWGVGRLSERRGIPLHLMPLASTFIRGATPVVGIAIALATFSLAGHGEPASELVIPMVAAWIVTAYGNWIMLRFEHSRKVRVGVIGSPGLAYGLALEFDGAGVDSHTVVGWLADGPPPENSGKTPCLGSVDEIRRVVERHSIELLVHSNGSWTPDKKPLRSRLELFDRVAGACLDLPVRLLEATQLYENLLGHVPLGQANSAWFQYLLHPSFRAGSVALKRFFDIVVASAMLIVMAPILTGFTIAIFLTDRGPIFYRQRRVGEHGREFQMIKLRSMRVDSEHVGPRWSTAEDDRVTPVGRTMRRFHIDEMPQLWNILRGEMTVVGPRPERRKLIVELEQQLSYYDRRHLVKPGLAGWAQARCGYGGSDEGTGWKLCHDLFYLKHRSIYFDFLILLENVRVSLGSGVQFGLTVPQEQFIVGN